MIYNKINNFGCKLARYINFHFSIESLVSLYVPLSLSFFLIFVIKATAKIALKQKEGKLYTNYPIIYRARCRGQQGLKVILDDDYTWQILLYMLKKQKSAESTGISLFEV